MVCLRTEEYNLGEESGGKNRQGRIGREESAGKNGQGRIGREESEAPHSRKGIIGGI